MYWDISCAVLLKYKSVNVFQRKAITVLSLVASFKWKHFLQVEHAKGFWKVLSFFFKHSRRISSHVSVKRADKNVGGFRARLPSGQPGGSRLSYPNTMVSRIKTL